MMLAGAVILAVALMALKPTLKINAERERWSSAAIGFFSGMLGGISSLTGPIIITYLMALNLKREEFVGGVSVIYFCGALPMYLAMFWFDRIGLKDLGFSMLALLPMFIGLSLGKYLRVRLDEAFFRKALLGFLVIIAALLLLK
jgi:uncharacterized protein